MIEVERVCKNCIFYDAAEKSGMCRKSHNKRFVEGDAIACFRFIPSGVKS